MTYKVIIYYVAFFPKIISSLYCNFFWVGVFHNWFEHCLVSLVLWQALEMHSLSYAWCTYTLTALIVVPISCAGLLRFKCEYAVTSFSVFFFFFFVKKCTTVERDEECSNCLMDKCDSPQIGSLQVWPGWSLGNGLHCWSMFHTVGCG